jgi:hypothetical protein
MNPTGPTTKPGNPGGTMVAGLPPGNMAVPQPGPTAGAGGGQSYCYGGPNGDQSCTSSFNQPYCFTQNGKQTCGTVSGSQTQMCSVANGKQNCTTQPMTSKFCASDGTCTNGLPPGYQPPTLFANNPATGTQASVPANPCNKSPAPLVLKPNTQLATPAPLPPPPNSGALKLLPVPLPPPSLPASAASTGNVCTPKPANTATHDSSPKKKKEVEKKPPRNNHNAENAAANAAAAAATATAIMGIVGAMGHRGGGGGGGGGGHYNPCHH